MSARDPSLPRERQAIGFVLLLFGVPVTLAGLALGWLEAGLHAMHGAGAGPPPDAIASLEQQHARNQLLLGGIAAVGIAMTVIGAFLACLRHR